MYLLWHIEAITIRTVYYAFPKDSIDENHCVHSIMRKRFIRIRTIMLGNDCVYLLIILQVYFVYYLTEKSFLTSMIRNLFDGQFYCVSLVIVYLTVLQ